MLLANFVEVQLPLLVIVESDDVYLQQQEQLLWFSLLRDLDWAPLRPIAAAYYEALWQFNEDQARKHAERRANGLGPPNPETREEATQRLLFGRPTLDDSRPVLYTLPEAPAPTIHVAPRTLRPGTTPPRLAGRAPKCFFAMFKAFVGMPLRGRAPQPQNVWDELRNNPAYARTCGFTLRDPAQGYRQSDVPGLRKLEQFDEIMTQNGLWGDAAVAQVQRNLQQGRIRPESDIVHDTTHYGAFSSMQVDDVQPPGTTAAPSEVLPPPPVPEEGTAGDSPAVANAQKPAQKKPKNPKRKSHPRTTKSCRCPDRTICPHPWHSADEGAGTVVKAGGKMYWAHKASTLCFPGQHVLLDAVAMSDAASHDSTSLVPHLERLFGFHPQLIETTDRVLDDGAADDAQLKAKILGNWDIELLAPVNPRRRGPLTDGLPRGVDHITPTGTPVCRQGFPFALQGSRRQTGHFIFRAPNDADGIAVCQGCPVRDQCYRGDHGARQITIPHARLPWLDPRFPQLSKRFAHTMAQRTAIERLHKLMKDDYGEPQLSKRGNDAFQALLDKTKLAMHLVIAHSS